jgi:hypothetical protein
MSLDSTVIAYYGTAASCTKYRMAVIDFAYASQQAPDKALWALAPQSGTIVDTTVSFPLIFRWDLVTTWSPVAVPIPPPSGQNYNTKPYF